MRSTIEENMDEVIAGRWETFDALQLQQLQQLLKEDASLEQLGSFVEKYTYFFPTRKQALLGNIELSDRLIEGYFKASSHHQEIKINMPPQWGESPLNNNNWMFILHTLRWLEAPINAYKLTNDEKYIRFINEVIEDWVSKNFKESEPSSFSWNDRATSYRLRLFVYYWHLYVDTQTFKENDVFNKRFILSIYQHILYHADEKNYHLKSNHSLEMIGAFLSATYTFKHDFFGMDAYFNLALSLLEKYLLHNFSKKGYHLEQSPGYHWYVLNRLVLINDFLEHFKIDTGSINEYITKSWRANHMLLKPSGDFHLLGDTGLLNIEEQLNVLKKNDVQLPSETFQLSDFEVCEQSGYAIFRNDAVHTIFKCNNFVGPHFHHDFLSFSLFAYGSDWIVDSGYYSYNENDSFRLYFRDAIAHNGLLINGEGLLAKSKKLPICIDELSKAVTAGSEWKAGEVRRTFRQIGNSDFLIHDEVVAKIDYEVEQMFHIHPSIKLKKITKHTVELENIDGKRCLLTQLNPVGEWNITKGQETPSIQGWYSSEFNKIEENMTLRYITKTSQTTNLKMYIHFE